MSKILHVHNEFHAVGHGTFFVGKLCVVDDERPGRDANFQWVFDCGSRRTTRIAQAIKEVEEWPAWRDEIDMVIVSHFDNDHVNGLERLLESNTVKTLVLPYASFRQRLACMASVHREMEAVAPEVALFGLDPIGYLRTRGLLEKIRSIVFVMGDNPGARDGGGSLDPDAGPDSERAAEWLDGTSDGQYGQLVGAGDSDRSMSAVLPQSVPVTLRRFGWEFVFFNAALPDEVATRSRAAIATVQAEVAEILRRNRVVGGSDKPKRGWRSDLRNCYIKHFGDSGPERNNISLCVLARPISRHVAQPCAYFPEKKQGTASISEELPVLGATSALLLTGDLELNADRIQEMQEHFRRWRWQALSVMQIPHHGSRHSWEPGNSAIARQKISVLCIPTKCNAGHHPHVSVVDDLAGHRPVAANYEQSVIQTYHVEILEN